MQRSVNGHESRRAAPVAAAAGGQLHAGEGGGRIAVWLLPARASRPDRIHPATAGQSAQVSSTRRPRPPAGLPDRSGLLHTASGLAGSSGCIRLGLPAVPVLRPPAGSAAVRFRRAGENDAVGVASFGLTQDITGIYRIKAGNLECAGGLAAWRRQNSARAVRRLQPDTWRRPGLCGNCGSVVDRLDRLPPTAASTAGTGPRSES